MAKSLNRAELIGNLGGDPESKTLPSGDVVVNFRLATSDSWKDKETGELKERTEWHNIKAWGKLAEIMAQYLSKGSKVFVAGEIQYRKFTNKEGVEQWVTEINAKDMLMLDSKQEGEARGNDRDDTAPMQSKSQQKRVDTQKAGVKDDGRKLPF